MSKPLALATALLAAAASLPASAAVNLVQNGDFETTTLSTSSQITGNVVANWSNAANNGYTGIGYTFLIFPGTADTTGFYSSAGNHDYLWGPGNGVGSANYSDNQLTATSPTRGNYIVADGDSSFNSALSQTVNGLSVGQTYMLTFYSAAAQFAGFDGTTTESWNVSFGNSSQNTPTVTTASHGFSPWKQQTMYFVASATSQVLSFLARGTPNGLPPTNLLDGVSLVAVPEPATLGLMGAGLAAALVLTRRRRPGRRAAGAAAG